MDQPVPAPDEVARILALTQDYEVRQALAQHPEGRRLIAQLGNAKVRADRQRTVRTAQTDPVLQRIDAQQALLDLDAALSQFNRSIKRILPRVRVIPRSERDPMAHRLFLELNLDKARSTLENVAACLDQAPTPERSSLRLVKGGV